MYRGEWPMARRDAMILPVDVPTNTSILDRYSGNCEWILIRTSMDVIPRIPPPSRQRTFILMIPDLFFTALHTSSKDSIHHNHLSCQHGEQSTSCTFSFSSVLWRLVSMNGYHFSHQVPIICLDMHSCNMYQSEIWKLRSCRTRCVPWFLMAIVRLVSSLYKCARERISVEKNVQQQEIVETLTYYWTKK